MLRLKRHEEPGEEYFDNFVREARQRRQAGEKKRPLFGQLAGTMKEGVFEFMRPKWVLGAGLATSYAGVMAAILLWSGGTGSMTQPNIRPASAEMTFSGKLVREVNFDRDVSDRPRMSNPKEF